MKNTNQILDNGRQFKGEREMNELYAKYKENVRDKKSVRKVLNKIKDLTAQLLSKRKNNI